MKEEIYQEFLKSYEEKYKDFKGFTRTQYNFIMWLIENKEQITQLGDLDDLFKSVRHFLKQ